MRGAARGRITVKTVFLTGAEGFTGTLLTHALRSRGYDVVGGVRNRARKLAFEKQHGKAVVCDVSDAINVARAVASVRPDGLIHLAGLSQPHMAANEPLDAYQSIVTAWANVLDAVRRVAPRAKVLLASACDVYGDAGQDGRALPEDTPLLPVTTFGSLKAAAEAIGQTYFRNYHTNITIVRPFHYTGARQGESTFFASVARRLAEWDTQANGTTLELPDLDCRRDLSHVGDVVQAYIALLESGQPNTTYNVCSGQPHTVREIVEQLIRASGLGLTLSEQRTDHPAPIRNLCGDNQRIRSHTDWKPEASLQKTVNDLLGGFRSQPAPAGQVA